MPTSPHASPRSSPAPSLSGAGRVLFGATAILTLWVTILVLTGGVDLRPLGIRVSSRDPFRPACLAVALLLVCTAAYPQQARASLVRLRAAIARAAPLLAIAASVYTLGLALRFGCNGALGPDWYGYVSQADLWLAGDLIIEQPLARELPWGSADWTLSPLGYRPTPSGGAIVPTYAPGLPLLMALGKLLVGPCGPYAIVPLFGALTVWMTYLLGTRIATRTVGVASAVLMGTSPAFLAHVTMPMSDVPVAASLVAAVSIVLSDVRGRAFWSGLALSLMLLVRPNLVPLVVVFVGYVWMRTPDWRVRLKETALLIAGVLPAVVAIGILHTALYGAPWRSGYGGLESLYAWQYLAINLARYPRWLFDTQTPFIAACLLPMVAAARPSWTPDRARTLFLAALIVVIWASYMFYLPFDDWMYLRFLLPAFPLMLVLAARGWQSAASRLRWEWRAAVVTSVVVLALGFQVGRVHRFRILERWRSECGQVGVAQFVDRRLPRNAVILAQHYSGAVRHYAHRLTVRYDLLDPAWWPRALEVLTAKGYRPYVALAYWEEAPFRERFGLPAATEALGTTVAQLGEPVHTRLYDPLATTSSGPAATSGAPAATASGPAATPGAPATTSDVPATPSDVPAMTPAVIPAGAPCPCMWRAGR